VLLATKSNAVQRKLYFTRNGFYEQGLSLMPFSVLWGRASLARTDVSNECIASIIKVERISELGTTLSANIVQRASVASFG
jgi:hypothetical protein